MKNLKSLLLALFFLLISTALAKPILSFPINRHVDIGNSTLTINADISVPAEPGAQPISLSTDDYDKLKQHLLNLSHYHYSNGWKGGEYEEENDLALLGVQSVDVEGSEVIIKLNVTARSSGVGKLTIDAPDEWEFQYKGGDSGTELSTIDPAKPKLFKFDAKLGATLQEGLSTSFSSSGLLSNSDSTKLSLSLSGLLPLYKPNFVGNDDRRSTAGDVDVLSLTLDAVNYQRGGQLRRYGIKGRIPSAFKGGEVVGYYGWLSLNYQSTTSDSGLTSLVFASDLELGTRWGDVEWSNLSTAPESTGNFLGRVAFLTEIWPRIGSINKNLTGGLGFYLRGRYWVDQSEISGTSVTRGRGFFDSELFYQFDDYRIFIRMESGMLPPNLSTYTNRVFLGMGARF